MRQSNPHYTIDDLRNDVVFCSILNKRSNSSKEYKDAVMTIWRDLACSNITYVRCEVLGELIRSGSAGSGLEKLGTLGNYTLYYSCMTLFVHLVKTKESI